MKELSRSLLKKRITALYPVEFSLNEKKNMYKEPHCGQARAICPTRQWMDAAESIT